jgi:hypothetical protein
LKSWLGIIGPFCSSLNIAWQVGGGGEPCKFGDPRAALPNFQGNAYGAQVKPTSTAKLTLKSRMSLPTLTTPFRGIKLPQVSVQVRLFFLSASPLSPVKLFQQALHHITPLPHRHQPTDLSLPTSNKHSHQLATQNRVLGDASCILHKPSNAQPIPSFRFVASFMPGDADILSLSSGTSVSSLIMSRAPLMRSEYDLPNDEVSNKMN